jgi:hypothetical protein
MMRCRSQQATLGVVPRRNPEITRLANELAVAHQAFTETVERAKRLRQRGQGRSKEMEAEIKRLGADYSAALLRYVEAICDQKGKKERIPG